MTPSPNDQSTNQPINQSTNFPAAAASQSTNPYVGPRTFSAEQRHLFFGREREARDLLARVLSERLLLFYAQSGAGKSSLVRTRLIPQLQEEKGFVVLPVGRVSGELPAGAGQVDNIFVFNLLLSIDQGTNLARLAHVTLAGFLARLTRQSVSDAQGRKHKGWVYDAAAPPAPASASSQRYALVVDQFEEIITSHPGRWREREDFFRQLDAAMRADPNLWVVLTLREDYVAALDPHAPFVADRLRARFYMERMGVAAALDAIRQPAALAGRPFTEGVAEKLADELRQVRVAGQEGTVAGQFVEPVQLQVVCYQLWEGLGRGVEGKEGKEGSGEEITFEDLAVAGDVDRALTEFYEETLAAALADPAAAGASELQLRTWFDKELITPAGTRGLVHQDADAAGGLPNGVVTALQRRFLVRAEARSGDAWIELVHDRFVEPIRQANRAWFGRNLNPLTLDAQAWRDAGKPADRLYRGSQLAAAAAQIAAGPADFGDVERAFVEAGQQVEMRRAARRGRAIAAIAAGLALLFILLAAWALWSRGQSQNEAQRAAAAEAQARIERSLALAQGGTAEAASTRAVVALATAQAANTAQVQAMVELEAALQINLTALAMAAPPSTPTATPSFALPASPSPSPQPGATPPPTATATRTSTPAPSPTANLLVVAQQTQLAQVRATQTALADVCGLPAGETFARAWDRSRLGCPTAVEADVTTAYEAFERGWMLWRKDTDLITVFFDGGEYRTFALPSEARPEFACAEAERLGNPRLGFGAVWCENPDLRQQIGNPLAGEAGGDRPVQEFEKGFMINLDEQNGVISALDSGQWTVSSQ